VCNVDQSFSDKKSLQSLTETEVSKLMSSQDKEELATNNKSIQKGRELIFKQEDVPIDVVSTTRSMSKAVEKSELETPTTSETCTSSNLKEDNTLIEAVTTKVVEQCDNVLPKQDILRVKENKLEAVTNNVLDHRNQLTSIKEDTMLSYTPLDVNKVPTKKVCWLIKMKVLRIFVDPIGTGSR
jgi:hypothetical protein